LLRYIHISIAATLMVSISLSSLNAETGPSIDLSKYELMFSDDFDQLDVSANGPGTKWIAHTPWGGDFGDAQFTDPGPSGPFHVNDGILSIEARKRPDGSWQSGLLSSTDRNGDGFSALYGYFEIRTKLPAGKGLWPGFWLDAVVPKGHPSVEVDIFEHYGHFPGKLQSTIHVWNAAVNKDNTQQTVTDVPPGSLYTEFHTYGADVEPDWITIYLDRKPIWKSPTPPEHKNRLTILVDLAMGSGWSIAESPNPSIMYVDYIRAWRRK
jgi:beta-glucanase (GH16 family)